MSFNRLVSRVRDIGAEASVAEHRSLSNQDPSSLAQSFDGIMLSGTEALLTRTNERKQFDDLVQYIPRIDVPLLGICGGHQAIALAYGGNLGKSGRLIEGFRNVELEDKDTLLAGLPSKIRVMQSHSEEVRTLPPQFIRTARSDDTKNEAMKHETKPIYGVQFHPERWNEDYQAGKRILENFIEKIALSNPR